MAQNLAAEISHCYERARQARETAERAINAKLKAESHAAENRWLAFAHSYEQEHSRSPTLAGIDSGRNPGAVTRMLWLRGRVFEPEVTTKLTIAYHAVLHQLGLVDREDGATLMVAKLIIDLVAQGERDTERLAAATVEALTR
jgi:hypothetical protein